MNKSSIPLQEWVIQKIKREYLEDIALLVAVEGASVNNDGHGEAFDYFVPATERGNELSQTFILNGVGKDLYPRSWERMERTADLEDPATICLGNAKIVYSRTKEDEERFEEIRKRLYRNLADPHFLYRKALENLDVAMNLYKTLVFEEKMYNIRGLAGFIHNYLSVSVACINGTYSDNWHVGMIPIMRKWKNLPEGFIENYERLLEGTTPEEIKNIAYSMILSSRLFIANFKPEVEESPREVDFHDLADWYQELKTTWNRLYFYCESEDKDATFGEAYHLQNEISIVSEEYGLGEMDLLGFYEPKKLQTLAKQAQVLESRIVGAIESRGIQIRQYESLEDFLKKNTKSHAPQIRQYESAEEFLQENT